ncbi:WcaF family extracellular polysaccharide biosynthesis acetyltransferase [Catalinimonas sp. 4WD22]|uniref:WcaF family extracellular polysaccharide biosynthesis acetyltransferase n=1 Tax=Catalinimonas locisalis TaxID=3133978 RepID=UPI00310164FB
MHVSKNFSSRVRLQDFDPSIGLDRGAGKLKETCWYLIKVLFFLSAIPYPSYLKTVLLRQFGARVGEGVIIKPRVNIHFPWKLEIGNHVWIGEEVCILNFEKLKIGSNVALSQRVFLCGGNHDFRIPSMPYRNASILLRDGCWIGACCFVGPGITIGTDAVVTAGSVIKTDLEENQIYSGNPAVAIKKRW